MSSSTPNDVEILQPAPVMRNIIDTTAAMVSQSGLDLEKRMRLHVNDTRFNFLLSSDPFHAYYQHQITVYRATILDGSLLIPRDARPRLERPRPLLMRCNLAFLFPQGITLKELGVIKLSALFVARYGSPFLRYLVDKGAKDLQLEFLNPNCLRLDFFNGLVHAYSNVLRSSKKMKKNDAYLQTVVDFFLKLLHLDELEEVEMHAFVCGVDCLAHMEDFDYSSITPPPGHLSMIVNLPTLQSQLTTQCLGDPQPDATNQLCIRYPAPEWFLLMDTAITKFTAQFVARYGMEVMKAVVKDPHFKFMVPTDRRFSYFNWCVDMYSRVFKSSQKKGTKTDVNAPTILEVFFDRLQLEKLKDGSQVAMIDLHAFVNGVDSFALFEEEESYAQPPLRQLIFTLRVPELLVTTVPEEPKPKNQKLEESALVPEEQSLVQHQRSSTIRVFAPDVDGGQVIAITMQSLSESVGSLKEQIAGEIQIPANRQKLSGKAGVLEDNNRSLAHYNVGAGAFLTLSS